MKTQLGKYFHHHSPVKRKAFPEETLSLDGKCVQCVAAGAHLSHIIPELMWPLWRRSSSSV